MLEKIKSTFDKNNTFTKIVATYLNEFPCLVTEDIMTEITGGNKELDDGETVVEADAITLRDSTEICSECDTCENADLCPTSEKEEDEAAPEDLQDNV